MMFFLPVTTSWISIVYSTLFNKVKAPQHLKETKLSSTHPSIPHTQSMLSLITKIPK